MGRNPTEEICKMAISFIHTADWQIGKQFGKITGDIAALLRESRFDAIKKLAQLANTNQVDAILVAGDVFDANEVSDTTLRRTLNAMSDYKGSWVLLPGNHDAALAQSVWTRISQLPEKTDNIILATEPSPILLANGQLAILPAPLKQRHEFKDLTEWFDHYDVDDGVFKVGLAHGSVKGWLPESAEIHNMISYERAQTAYLDYLALGDWHGQRKISPKIWYSGTPEQDRFSDNEPGKALLVTLKEKGSDPVVDPLEVGTYQWHRLSATLFGENDITALDVLFRDFKHAETQLVRLSLIGNLSLELRQKLMELLELWRARLAMLDVDDHELKITPNEDDLQDFSSVGFLGKAVEKLLSIRDDNQHEDQPYAERAIQLLWHQLQLSKGEC
jgi:DNA repair exonuclease SbcCD nuclease subunit